ncbi:MAG: iron-sulfur cluster carrier protein ApbC [Sphingomonadales bacterium]|nr:iron-sulfur cluster carrier protein ApbC [Sphingomonadales bacterium]
MTDLSRETVLNALTAVTPPGSEENVVARGWITGLVIKDGNVGFAIDLGGDAEFASEALQKACEDAVRAVPGVLSVTAVLTAERAGGAPAQASAPAPKPASEPPPPPRIGGHGRPLPRTPEAIPGIAAILAVASGKGGVGKSTTAVNLAVALAGRGLRVGILDADIYGPSIPRMFGITDRPSAEGEKIAPFKAHGLAAVMSIGFMVPEDTPTIWRGPMVMGALTQLLGDVAWGELDVLVVDMPPGTGDAQLTLVQRVPVTGAVIVSTPQDIALIDARKGLAMFERVKVPVFGIVENMSTFVCPHCGERSDIFGHGGAKETAVELGCDFLGEVPLHLTIREHADAGTPIAAAQPAGEHAAHYRAIAEKVAFKLAEARPAEAETRAEAEPA